MIFIGTCLSRRSQKFKSTTVCSHGPGASHHQGELYALVLKLTYIWEYSKWLMSKHSLKLPLSENNTFKRSKGEICSKACSKERWNALLLIYCFAAVVKGHETISRSHQILQGQRKSYGEELVRAYCIIKCWED